MPFMDFMPMLSRNDKLIFSFMGIGAFVMLIVVVAILIKGLLEYVHTIL